MTKNLVFKSTKFFLRPCLFYKVDHFARRMWIRETWGQIQPSLFKRKAVYFFLGKSMNQSVNEAVRRENQRYRDIVQAGKENTVWKNATVDKYFVKTGY